MKLRFLGTGTSTGVPQLRCKCRTCLSSDPRDKRLRTSALLTTSKHSHILIDCGPDFYHQMLKAGGPPLDALIITHSHYDHVGGIDDLRPFCANGPFPVYCQKDVSQDLRERVPYCFAQKLYPGVPTYQIHEIEPYKEFEIDDCKIIPLSVKHYKLNILGFKVGKLGYITDCKELPNATINELLNIDTLVINSLRIEKHISHINLAEALDIISKIKPRIAYLTHLSHQMGLHGEVETNLPANVFIAYDGLEITF